MIRGLALALLVIAGTARADGVAVELPRTKAVLHVPAAWKRVDDVAGLVAAYRSPKGALVAVTRAQVPNADAWMGAKQREAYAAQVERGALRKLVRTKRNLGEAAGIPALDLEATRDDGATIVMRILLYRTYALAVTIEVPRGGELDEARAIAGTFAQPKATDRAP